jgi:hypothetical protein
MDGSGKRRKISTKCQAAPRAAGYRDPDCTQVYGTQPISTSSRFQFEVIDAGQLSARGTRRKMPKHSLKVLGLGPPNEGVGSAGINSLEQTPEY